MSPYYKKGMSYAKAVTSKIEKNSCEKSAPVKKPPTIKISFYKQMEKITNDASAGVSLPRRRKAQRNKEEKKDPPNED